MGYKLAGYSVEGFCEIDQKMAQAYLANNFVEHPFIMPIGEFNSMIKDDVPVWLRNIDILDGSPPCSSFSMAGSREAGWGKNKKFREGQAEQILDNLFFHFIETARIVQPRIVIAENVTGMLAGNARKYVAEIFLRFKDIGYDVQLFKLDASRMGVPQKRQRVFFVARRRHIGIPKLSLEFNEPPVSIEVAFSGLNNENGTATAHQHRWYKQTPEGKSFSFVHPKGSWFNSIRLHRKYPAPTLAASGGSGGLYHYNQCRKITDRECLRVQSFPDDFNLAGNSGQYICGMSVPPLMMQRVAGEVAKILI